ncbi:MAG: PQQ-binding-like beta-propeller repeat protein [Candidatus Hydrogenedentes bacterium]|nr:PQQ-binding-like beta-propeller repeat protein [Candidatus Hydrogenedentota bacterium]
MIKVRLESPPGRAWLGRALRRVLTSKILWVVLLVALACGSFYFHFRPRITFIPVTTRGGELVIQGHGFGKQQRENYVLYRESDRPLDVFEGVRAWNDRGIVVDLPAEATAGGYVQVVKKTPLWEWASNAAPFVVRAPDLPSQPFGYDTPVRADSPWPVFRRDRRNTGRSTLPAIYTGDRPWSFRTSKGIFSTPVIDGEGTVYFGSADRHFYALNPDGTLKWRFQTGELIDSAAALHRVTPGEPPSVTFASGDGFLYHLRTDDGVVNPAERVLWTFNAAETPGAGYNNWWEGNVQIGFDGAIYAGNTNWNYYAIYPDGRLKWALPTRNNNWSVAGIGNDGTLFWGSCDTAVYAVAPDGQPRWKKRTLGFVAGSAAIGGDGTVYIGSFDTNVYAFAPDSPWPKWKFKTGDHVYASPALAEDAAGETTALYIGSTDGRLYALDPKGRLRWSYDAGDPIRSSPALGAGPDGEPDAIVYFGCGNGRLYALNTADGSRRWSFDTTPLETELRDRNDLNGSPALGQTGVYIGGEHGYLWYVPYDYCLRADCAGAFQPALARCDTRASEEWPDTLARLYYVTPGGNTLERFPENLPTATTITLRLVVREDGDTVKARVNPDGLNVAIEPDIPFHFEPSAGGDYLYVIPDDFLSPGADYALHITGTYLTGGRRVGNLTFGGRESGRIDNRFVFRAAPPDLPALPVTIGERETSAVEFTRLAVPVPTMLPSLNQIGFDFIEMILGAATVGPPDEQGRGDCVLWAIGGRHDEHGMLIANAGQSANTEADFTFALSGRYQGNDFILDARNVTLGVTGIDIPFRRLQLRGRLGPDGHVRPGATACAETPALAIPTFGPLLIMAGLANNLWEKLLVMGAYVTRPYPASGPANRRPAGVSVRNVEFHPPEDRKSGYVIATLRLKDGVAYPLDRHRPGILLLDAATHAAVPLDYGPGLRCTHDGHGNLSTITLKLACGEDLPEHLEAVVMLDVFPLHTETLR